MVDAGVPPASAAGLGSHAILRAGLLVKYKTIQIKSPVTTALGGFRAVV